MQSLSKNYQSVEESNITFENSPLCPEISHQGKSESPNTGKHMQKAICQLRKKNQTPQGKQSKTSGEQAISIIS